MPESALLAEDDWPADTGARGCGSAKNDLEVEGR